MNKPPIIDDASRSSSLRRTLLQDIRRGDLTSALRRDLGQVYHFYLDEERRARLASMGRLRRCFWIVLWTLKSLLMRLSPSRRILLLLSMIMFFLGRVELGGDGTGASIDLRTWSYVVLFLVLMVELKDKLLARDEIEVARQVQLALLPQRPPVVPGWSVWSYMRPANDVGADLVDYLDLDDGKVGIVLGDVAGKGLGAALLTAKLQASLRALLPGLGSLASLGNQLNTILHRDGLDNRFATLVYFEITPGHGRVRLLNAGHNPPFVLKTDRIESLDAASLPLGMMPAAACVEGSVTLEPGEMLVAYSDGLTEARNAQDEEFGEDRLKSVLPDLRGLSPERAGLRILGTVNAFLGAERPHDDLSLIVLLRES